MITVCIHSYKYGHLVSQAIESVLGQTRKADRIIVVDDGVGDVKPEYDNVEYVLRPENRGIVESFNDVLKGRVHEGKLLMLGADNWLRPDALELLDSQNAHIVTCDIALFGEDVDIFKQGLPARYENGYWVWSPGIHGSALYDVKKAQQAGGYAANPDSVKSEEDKMLFEAMMEKGASYMHVREPLLYYRRHKRNFQ